MENKSSAYSHILKYTGLFGGVQALNILMGLVRNKVAAVLLGPAGMGVMSLFMSTITLVVNSTNFGLHISAVRNISLAFEKGDGILLRHEIHVFRVWIMLTAMLGLVVCMALSPLLSDWTFSFGDHTFQFLLLAPVVALTTITAGETAILKATRHLKELAVSSLYGAFAMLVVSAPIYWYFGSSGIVPVILLIALSQVLIVTVYSLRLFPLRLRLAMGCVREGTAFLRLGLAFVVAGMFGSGAEFVIRAYLSHVSDVDTVGLYNAMYVMIFTYAGMVFTAFDTDYYPRLSAIRSCGGELNGMINGQIEVTMNLVSPMIILFILFMPVLLPLLYSGEFNAVLPMLQVAALSMYGRGVFLPLEYVALSRGDSLVYLGMEIISNVMLVAFVVVGYDAWGLTGMGAAVSVAFAIEMFLAAAVCRTAYGYSVSPAAAKTVAAHLLLGVCTYLSTLMAHCAWCAVAGVLLFAADAGFSFNAVRRNTAILEKLAARFMRRKK